MDKKIKKLFQDFIDDLKPQLVDRVVYIAMLVASILLIYLFLSTFRIFTSIEIIEHSKLLYSILIINAVGVFYFSMLGEKTSKPVSRPKVYLFTTLSIAIATYTVLAEVLNAFFVGAIETLIDMTTVPAFIVQTNSKILTVLLPVIIVSIGFYKSMAIAFGKEYKSDLQEYKVDWLTRNVEKIDTYNIDCKICEDFETGEDVYLTEKQSFRHMLVAGNSGSGKTSLVLRPYIAQLFYKKALFREELKQLTLEALNEGLCETNVAVTNKYFNENFSMDLINVNEDRKEEFTEKYKKLILGVREADKQIYNRILVNGTTFIPISHKKDVVKTVIHITSLITGIEEQEFKIEYISSDYACRELDEKEYKISISLYCKVDGEEDKGPGINMKFEGKSDNQDLYTYKVVITQHTKGKIIYRNTGLTTIAPDGGLGEQTVKIGAANGVKVHKIDPKMEEIRKGHIATYNPMMLGDPEQTGDIIASILNGMEDGDVDAYYKNAGIRAIRNLVILLRVIYPITKPNTNPTLENLLGLLNDFGKVEKLCEEMKKHKELLERWKSVIEYLESNFYEMKVDNQGNRVKGTNCGINRKKCQEAVTGTINQLDNFIGREEIRYILCNENEGMNLNDVLENGECIAIATRQAELGDVIGRAFALFFIMSLQTAVLSRYSEDEAPEIPYEIIIDEFPFYLNDGSKIFFTFSRKYKCSVTCVIQNIAQLQEQSDTFKEIILTNTNTKLILPGSNVEDRMYYSELLGFEDVFEMKTGISSTPLFSENSKYMETKSGAITEKNRVSKEQLGTLEFKNCYYQVTDVKGKTRIAKGTLDFLKLTEENTIKNSLVDFKGHLKVIKKKSIEKDSDEKDSNKVKIKIVEQKKEVEKVDYDYYADNIDSAALTGAKISEIKTDQLASKDIKQNLEAKSPTKNKEADKVYEVKDKDRVENKPKKKPIEVVEDVVEDKPTTKECDKANVHNEDILDSLGSFTNKGSFTGFSQTNICSIPETEVNNKKNKVQESVINQPAGRNECTQSVKNEKVEIVEKSDKWERKKLSSLLNTLTKKNIKNDTFNKVKELLEYDGRISSEVSSLEREQLKNIRLNKNNDDLIFVIAGENNELYIFFKSIQRDRIIKLLNINNSYKNTKKISQGVEKNNEK
ncbi:MAG: TraM recognition domain-containing protein [Clostridium sp.]